MAYQDPKPSRQRRQKRRDKRLTDGISYRQRKTVERSGIKRRKHRAALAGALPQRERMTERLECTSTRSLKTRRIKDFLLRHVGQSWAIVYTKLRREAGDIFHNGRYLHEYAKGYVARKVTYGKDGQLYYDRAYRYYQRRVPRGMLYVEPATGILRQYTPRKRQFPYLVAKNNRLLHPIVRTKKQKVLPDTCYDLRLRYRGETAELRVRLSSVSTGEDRSWVTLACRHRKGRCPSWFGGDATHLRGDFSLHLYRRNGFRLEWHENYDYHSLGHQHVSLELLEAGKLLVE